MRKILFAILAAAISGCCLSLTAQAQPRAAGIRVGVTGSEASYQHTFGKNFLEAETGVDFGHGGAGFKAAALYNFIFARPAWTDRGSWGLYAGPGLAVGYVSDRTTYMLYDRFSEMSVKVHPLDYGFMIALAAQIGLEYNFWFPLQLSLDIRPYFGLHVNDGFHIYESKAGFYNYGMMGFIPTLSVRYRF